MKNRGSESAGAERNARLPASALVRMQLLHRLVELPVRRQRQHIQCAADAAKDRILILRRWPPKHPARDLVAVPGMTDADAQAVELAVAEMGESVARPFWPP